MSQETACVYCGMPVDSGSQYCTICEIERTATGFEKLYGREAGMQIQRELQERAERKRLSEKARRVGLPEAIQRRREFDEQLEKAKRQAYMDLLNSQVQMPYVTRTQWSNNSEWGQTLAAPPVEAKPAEPAKPARTSPPKPNKIGRLVSLEEE